MLSSHLNNDIVLIFFTFVFVVIVVVVVVIPLPPLLPLLKLLLLEQHLGAQRAQLVGWQPGDILSPP